MKVTGGGTALAKALSDANDRLVSADTLLAALQRRCGGELPGIIAIPALLETVRKARHYRLRLARAVTAQDGAEVISTWIEVSPRSDGEEGCEIVLRSWHAVPLAADDEALHEQRRALIDRDLAELTARLDAGQRLLAVEAEAPDLQQAAAAMRSGIGNPWTDFVTIVGSSHMQPMHWRLLDGVDVDLPGSQRRWRAQLYPQEVPGAEPSGFELCLTSEEPLPAAPAAAAGSEEQVIPDASGIVGRDIAPVLRQPLARIIANAETIRSRLAGPLAEEYSNYAADIAAAGEHLLALLDDLADLEMVESDDFTTTPDPIDVADVARRAAGILGIRARERGIVIDAPRLDETLPAIAEFRRVLQILLNLLGNAIRYAPENSQVWMRLEEVDGRARAIVADQGPGLDDSQQVRIFEKFERLGRSGDGGSGLGLYISRRLARTMGGNLTVESAPGQGARFILELPADSAAADEPDQGHA